MASTCHSELIQVVDHCEYNSSGDDRVQLIGKNLVMLMIPSILMVAVILLTKAVTSECLVSDPTDCEITSHDHHGGATSL